MNLMCKSNIISVSFAKMLFFFNNALKKVIKSEHTLGQVKTAALTAAEELMLSLLSPPLQMLCHAELDRSCHPTSV